MKMPEWRQGKSLYDLKTGLMYRNVNKMSSYGKTVCIWSNKQQIYFAVKGGGNMI